MRFWNTGNTTETVVTETDGSQPFLLMVRPRPNICYDFFVMANSPEDAIARLEFSAKRLKQRVTECRGVDDYISERVLTKEEADKVNEGEDEDAPKYNEGDTCGRFFSEEEIVALAKETWRKLFPEATLLILGERCVADPQEIIDGDDKVLIKKANKLWKQFVENNYWEEDEVKAEKIYQKWVKLIPHSWA